MKTHDQVTALIIAYEEGQLDEDEIEVLFQDLIDSGLAWELQGHYGRTACQLIVAGRCTRNTRINHRTGASLLP